MNMNLVNCLALLLVWHAHSVSNLPAPVVSQPQVRVSTVKRAPIYCISVNMRFLSDKFNHNKFEFS